MNKKYLTSIFLLVAMLLGAFNSFPHDVQVGEAMDECVCHLADHAPVERGGLPDHAPDSHNDNCCDCEGCCLDAAEPSTFCGLGVTVSVKQLFHQRFFVHHILIHDTAVLVFILALKDTHILSQLPKLQILLNARSLAAQK